MAPCFFYIDAKEQDITIRYQKEAVLQLILLLFAAVPLLDTIRMDFHHGL